MKFATFIVVDDTLLKRHGEVSFTVNGDVIYPLETPMPVIRKGTGCIGVGMIKSSTRSKSATTITFILSKCNEESARAYYDLYRNQISISPNTDDVYDAASDMVIPGMMASAGIKPKVSSDNYRPRRKKESHTSLTDYLNDDDDDDSDDDSDNFFNNPKW